MGDTRRRTPPQGLVELLRLLVVLFFAGVGYQVAGVIGSRDHNVLGALNGAAAGVIVGSGIGYVVGGMLGRSALQAADRTEAALHEVPADTLVAGAIGTVVGVLVGAGIAWPLFLVPEPMVAVPLFGFVVAILGYVGFRVGASKRDGVLTIFGGRAGVSPRRQAPSARLRVLDTSVAIDGRVLDVVRAGFLHGTFLVSTAVLDELQGLADAADDTRRARGRRGLEMLDALRREPAVELDVVDDEHPEVPEVDAKLVRLALDHEGSLLTLDTNLAKAASLAGASVLNLHALALALRPPVSAGDDISVLLLKPGKEPGQAVGYLDDGTMVVVERARDRVGGEAHVRVSSVLTTANGRMVFGQLLTPSAPSPLSIPPRRSPA
ncbi:MAG TPA: PIN domain-containing protein [Mycobacteriales bacterium]|nr:PIN domain-containing protein [Mycobacteriales bacterium]